MVTHNEDSDRTVPTFGRGVLLAAGALNLGLGLGIPIALSVMFLDWQGSFATSRAATAAVQSTCMGILFGGGVYYRNKRNLIHQFLNVTILL